MTNKELQEKLKGFPSDMEVGITADSNVIMNEVNPHITKLYDAETMEEVCDFISLGDVT